MTLFQTFVDASETERARYVVVMNHSGKCYVCEKQSHHDSIKTRVGSVEPYLLDGTRAECTRWITEQAARKGFEAMRDAVKEDPLMSTDIIWWIANFLDTLAAEPETSSGDVR